MNQKLSKRHQKNKPTEVGGAIARCYLCGGTKLKIIKRKLRYNIKRNVFKCQTCGLVFLQPRKTNFKNFYSRKYRKLYTPVLNRVLDSEEIFNIYFPQQQRRINEIKHILNSKMRVLEIGCSAGHFLYALKDYVKECVGIEFNKDDAEFVNKKLGIKTYTEPIENTDIPPGRFDLIVLYFILEHLPDPIKFLKIISKYLKRDGYICIKVPNVRDSLLSIYNIKAYSDFWFREPHIYYFSSKTLSMVLEKSGLNGDIKTAQEYNFLNQINWILKGRPQKSADIGMSEPKLVTSNLVDKQTKKDFNQWIQRVNKEYFELLNKHGVGENLLFIGKKVINKNE